MKKSWWILMASLLSVLLVLSACGTESADEDTTESTDDTEVEETEVEEETEDGTADEEASDSEEAEESTETEESEGDQEGNEETADSEGNELEVVEENDAFRIYEPAPNSVVDNEFIVRGEARVTEGTLHYEFEDGHNILDEGTVTLSEEASEWGEFEFTVTFEDVAFESGTLILFEESAEDGSRQNQLYLPVTVEK